MESLWKNHGIHVEKPWNPCEKTMESIHHSMESIHQKYGIHLEFLQSIPPSMDSTWNNPGRVKYWNIHMIANHSKPFMLHTNHLSLLLLIFQDEPPSFTNLHVITTVLLYSEGFCLGFEVDHYF